MLDSSRHHDEWKERFGESELFFGYILDVGKRIKPLTSVEIIILHNKPHPTPGNLVLFNPDVSEEYFHLFFVTFKCQIEFLTAKYVRAALPAFPEYSGKMCYNWSSESVRPIADDCT